MVITRRKFIAAASGLFVPAAMGQVYLPHRRKAWRGSGASITYVVQEDFEGAGTPSGWSGTANYNYTTTPLEGTQSLNCTSNQSVTKGFTGGSATDVYFMFRCITLPAYLASIFYIQTSGGGLNLCIFRVRTTGQIDVYTSGADSTPTVDSMSTNTTYHVWMSWVSSGLCSVEFNTVPTRVGSGNKFASITGGTSGTSAMINPTAYGDSNMIFDKIRVAVGQTIGSNPT